MADKKVSEYYSPPVKMGKWEGFKKFLWNSETSQCLGRTGSSWGKYLLYLILNPFKTSIKKLTLCIVSIAPIILFIVSFGA